MRQGARQSYITRAASLGFWAHSRIRASRAAGAAVCGGHISDAPPWAVAWAKMPAWAWRSSSMASSFSCKQTLMIQARLTCRCVLAAPACKPFSGAWKLPTPQRQAARPGPRAPTYLHGPQLLRGALPAQHALQVVPAQGGGRAGVTARCAPPMSRLCQTGWAVKRRTAPIPTLLPSLPRDQTLPSLPSLAHLQASSCAWMALISGGMSSALPASCSIRSVVKRGQAWVQGWGHRWETGE